MELIGEQKQAAALANVYEHLREHGLFICTLHNPAQRTRLATGEKVFRGEFALPGNQILKLYSEEYIQSGQSMISGIQYYMIYNKKGELLMERRLDIRFSLIEGERFEQLANQACFKVEKLYGDYNRNHSMLGAVLL